jgi:FkbM family methyltransferase
VQRFETEAREIYVEREAIVDLIGLKAGSRIADIGAGTGLFTFAFSQRVGPRGKVFAVDIAPRFLEHLRASAKEQHADNVVVIAATQDDSKLAANSIDFAFLCDTYHHFEYPAQSLASIHRALAPGGELILIDFHRIEGVSQAWLLEHVRAGEEVFTREIVAAGFEPSPQATPAGLVQNYVLRFRRR